MGGYLSTRWNGVRTRQDTEPLLRLDIAILRRRGLLTAGTTSWIELLNRSGQPVCSIQLQATVNALTLLYQVRAHGQEWFDIYEHIALEWTPCHYGGSRLWFQCPQCHTRRRVLYSMGGRFRCRACHDLAYTSTRLDAMERSVRRIGRLHRRLRAYPRDLLGIPPRPAGMRHATYDRICADLLEAQARYGECLNAGYARLLGRDGWP